jgi:hypothetical protein
MIAAAPNEAGVDPRDFEVTITSSQLRGLTFAAHAMSLRELAAALTSEGILTPAGASKWSAVQVSRVRARIAG